MVDLVKIRNKKKKERPPAEEPSGATGSQPVEPQAEADGLRARPSGEPAARDAAEPAGDDAGAPPASSKLDKFKAEAGKRRDLEIAKTEEQETGAQLELLTFVIAGEQYAVDIERIVEIVTPRAVTRIPNADASVVGIMSLRGTIVTLVDVRRKLRHPAAGEPGPDARIVVVDFHHEIIGFLVDRVLRVVKAAAADVERHPVVHATELDDSVRGVFRVAGALTILLDLDKLLDHGSLAARSA
ncbi:MAG TPA: chemotaxis protein CheW [Thermoanaerobaculia bacterium]|nr:chemotaxis protein CheW [Thermoanaerobaculia bacterium]